MVWLAVIALLGGIACGMAGLDSALPVEMIVLIRILSSIS